LYFYWIMLSPLFFLSISFHFIDLLIILYSSFILIFFMFSFPIFYFGLFKSIFFSSTHSLHLFLWLMLAPEVLPLLLALRFARTFIYNYHNLLYILFSLFSLRNLLIKLHQTFVHCVIFFTAAIPLDRMIFYNHCDCPDF